MKYMTVLIPLAFLGCVSTSSHVKELHSSQERELTLGTVQRDVRAGMSQGDVASLIGAPNIVSTDEQGQEVWIYDKVATENSYSASSAGVFGLGTAAGVPGTTSMLGLGSGSYSTQGGASASTQKTLTVVIRFDNSRRVESMRYHASKF